MRLSSKLTISIGLMQLAVLILILLKEFGSNIIYISKAAIPKAAVEIVPKAVYVPEYIEKTVVKIPEPTSIVIFITALAILIVFNLKNKQDK